MKIKLILPLLLILLFVTSVNAIVDPFLTIDGETEISFGETITFNAGFISSHEPVHMAIKLLDSSKSLINLIKDEDIYWLPDTTSYVEKFTLTRDDYKKGGQYYINYIVEMFNPDLGKTETDTEEISFEVSKVAPKLIKDIEDIEFDEDNTYTLDLDEYFDDDEEEQLTYTASSVSDIDADIQDSIVTLKPDLDWNGDRTVTFYAFDGIYTTPSNPVNIKVNPVDDPAKWQTLEDKHVNEESPDNTVVYENIKSKCSDIDSELEFSIKPLSHSHYVLDFSGDDLDLIIKNMEKDYVETETVILVCNNIEASFNLIVDNVNDRPVIDSYSPLTAVNMKINEQQTFTVTANDVDNPTLHYDWYVNEIKQDERSNSFTYTALGNLGNRFIRVEVYDDELSALNPPSWTFDVYEKPTENKLAIIDLDVKVDDKKDANLQDGDKISHKAHPESKVIFDIEIENLFETEEDIEIEDIVVGIAIIDIDNNDDLEEESEEFDLGPGKSKEISLKFDIPLLVDIGEYEVEIFVEGEDENDNMHELEWTLYLEVEIPLKIPPNAIIDTPESDKTINVSESVYFTGHGEDDGTIIAYSWNFGNGRSSTEQNPGNVQFNTVGTYTITFDVQDNDNEWDPTPATVTVTVKEKKNNPPYTPHSPDPENKATNVEITKILSWQGGDPDTGDSVTYDIYSGSTKNNLYISAKDLTSPEYKPFLEYSTTYYWKIIAKDNHNASAESSIWQFTTKAKPIITNKPPQSYIDKPSSDITRYVGSTITFSGHGVDPGGNDITAYEWQLTGPSSLTTSRRTFSYRFNKLGTYKVYFKTKDHELWDQSPAVRTITIISRPAPPPPPPPVNHAPVLANIQNKYVYETQTLNFRITASDQDNDPLTYSASNLPQGATFETQIFNWIPNYDQAGTYYVTFAVSDRKLSDSQRVKITVYNTNRKPEIISTPITKLKMDKDFTKEYQYKVKTIDADNDSLIYSLIVKPFNMFIDSITGLIKWKPTKEQIGLNDVSVQVSDKEDADTQSFAIDVIYNEPVTLAKQKIHINSLYIINDEVKPGQEMLTNVAFTNEDYYKTKGRITVSIPELGIRKRSNFNLDSKEAIGKVISLEIPEYTKGEYIVKITISDNDASRTKYRFVNII